MWFNAEEVNMNINLTGGTVPNIYFTIPWWGFVLIGVLR